MRKIPCILLVDDDETTNFVNSLVVKKSGFADNILVAPNGKIALEIIQRHFRAGNSNLPNEVPWLVLLDIKMPVMDGLEFMECFSGLEASIRSNVIVQVLTTSMHPKDLKRMSQLGLSGFVNKPLQRESLERILDLHFNSEAT